MATCNVCHAQYNWGENPCWRCGQDNTAWEEQRELPTRRRRFTDFFGNIWGVIAIVINVFAALGFILALLGFLVGGIYAFVSANWATSDVLSWQGMVSWLRVDKSTLMGWFLAWLMSLIATFVIYAVRFQLWEYSWLRNVQKPKLPNLYTIAIAFFLLGSFLLLTWLTLTMFFYPEKQEDANQQTGQTMSPVLPPGTSQSGFDQPTAEQPQVAKPNDSQQAGEKNSNTPEEKTKKAIQKILMPAMLGFIFALFAGGSMLMSAGLYVARLNENMVQPIYMNTKLLTDVVQQVSAESLEWPLASTRPSAIKRTDDGGIEMILNYVKPDSGSEPTNYEILRRYKVEANKWGQISSLVEDAKLPKEKQSQTSQN